jgi:hypothetical protein
MSVNKQLFWTKAKAARVLGLEARNIDGLVRHGLLRPARTYPGVKAVYRPADVLGLRQKFERSEGTCA